MKSQIGTPRTARSLAATLAIALSALSAVALLISGGIQLFSNIQAQQAAISGEQQLIAQQASKSVADFVQQRFSVLETAVGFTNPFTAAPDSQKLTLDSLLGLQPALRQLALLDGSGRVLTLASRQSLAQSSQFTSQLQSDLIAATRAGERYISQVYIDDLTNEPLVIMAVPGKDVFGDYQGTLAAEVNLKFMWDLVDQLNVGETGYAYVVDDQGKLLAFGDTARVLRGENAAQIKKVGEFVTSPIGMSETAAAASTYTGMNGETVLGSIVPLGTPQWAVVTEQPLREAYGPLIQVTLLSIASMLVMAGLGALAGVVLARRLAVPLVDLTTTATRIAAGEMQLQAGITGPQEISALATAFNSMTAQLRDLVGSLEHRVADRTKALATSAEVSRRLSTVLDEQQLVREVVELVQSSFDYYHAHIYLVDPATGDLAMAGGTGEAGQTMLERGHKIRMGAGLVGRAAQTNKPVLVPDVSEDPQWLPNPLLPFTKSEVAVPIAIGDEVLGVLDVQHHVSDGLRQQDADMLQAIANQTALALRNARSYTDIRNRAERESLIAAIGQKIEETASVESALKVAVRELGQALRSQTSVQLKSADGGKAG
jgi:putative methionine-R-sulfoxide reductase with GAF domain